MFISRLTEFAILSKAQPHLFLWKEIKDIQAPEPRTPEPQNQNCDHTQEPRPQNNGAKPEPRTQNLQGRAGAAKRSGVLGRTSYEWGRVRRWQWLPNNRMVTEGQAA